MQVKITKHLRDLAKKYPAIKKQFFYSRQEEKKSALCSNDPLEEEKYMPVKGLLHKYSNRVLALLTMNCAAYCRFCTRKRSVSRVGENIITEKDLQAMVGYIKKHPEVREVIISGGDPLTVPALLKKALRLFGAIAQIKVIRVGTRLPISDPEMVSEKVIEALEVVKRQPVYILLHVNHPAELTTEALQAIRKIQLSSTMVLSQTVFLKGVNDSVTILQQIFTRLLEIGVKPYYLLRCEPVQGANHFIIDPKKEVALAAELRKRLSGLACPLYVIDSPNRQCKTLVALKIS